VDNAASGVSTAERTIVLTAPTCSALGLSEQRPVERDVAAGALRLLEDKPDVREVVAAQSFLDSLDELVVGVVEAVEECVVTVQPDCVDLRARAKVEAARWVDDFLADDVRDERYVGAQQAMFLLAQLLADAVADALIHRDTRPRPIASGRTIGDVYQRAAIALTSVIGFGAVVRWINGLGICRAIRSRDASGRPNDLPVVGVRLADD
jgi:hypothetical protein